MENLGCLDTSQCLQVGHVGLCIPYLDPKDVCMLRCTCRELRDMPVSWRHHSINFFLNETGSAKSWLLRTLAP
jgi:hypothetical protein